MKNEHAHESLGSITVRGWQMRQKVIPDVESRSERVNWFRVSEATRLQVIKDSKHCILQRLGAEQDQLPCGSTGTCSSNCQETDICLVWACHTPRLHLQNYSSGHLGGLESRSLQKKCWMDNLKEWTSLPMPELLTRASCRKDWKRISAESSLMSPRQPSWSRD